jgi:hypothetical protein
VHVVEAAEVANGEDAGEGEQGHADHARDVPGCRDRDQAAHAAGTLHVDIGHGVGSPAAGKTVDSGETRRCLGVMI